MQAWWRCCHWWWWNQSWHLGLTEWDLVKKVTFTASGEEQRGKKINWNLIMLTWVTLGFFPFINWYVLVLQFISVTCSFSCSRKCLEITMRFLHHCCRNHSWMWPSRQIERRGQGSLASKRYRFLPVACLCNTHLSESGVHKNRRLYGNIKIVRPGSP